MYKRLDWTVALLPLISAACDNDRGDLAEERAEAVEETRTPLSDTGGVTNEATAVPGMHATAVKQITTARCDREQKCGNVGAGKDYATSEACVVEVSDEWRDELNAYECPGGVVTKELSECLAEIRNEDCDAPFDTLGRIIACRESDICKAT